jgi:hypothetical protein
MSDVSAAGGTLAGLRWLYALLTIAVRARFAALGSLGGE